MSPFSYLFRVLLPIPVFLKAEPMTSFSALLFQQAEWLPIEIDSLIITSFLSSMITHTSQKINNFSHISKKISQKTIDNGSGCAIIKASQIWEGGARDELKINNQGSDGQRGQDL